MEMIWLSLIMFSAFGGIVNTILLLIGLINKKFVIPIKASGIMLCIMIIFFIGSIGSYIDIASNNQIVKIEEQQASKEEQTLEVTTLNIPKTYEYDILQKVFLQIDTTTTVEELEKLISENSLKYSYNERGKSQNITPICYRIAYTEGATKQRYSDPGDYIEVNFHKENNKRFLYARYVNSKNSFYSALIYNYGTYWSFSEPKEGRYRGYYIKDSASEEKGITITYPNGARKETHYFKYDSVEEILQKVIDKINEEN